MTPGNIAVTGASRGIGRAIALKFAQSGFNVAINCLKNSEKLKDLQKEIMSFGVSCIAYTGDMGNPKCAEEFFNIIASKWGCLDILVNNAGISYVGLIQDMTYEQWNTIVNTNLSSVFNCSKCAVNMMLSPKKGKIINISSVWGVTGASTEAAYSATKGGINAFTKAIAKELAPSNIQVNAIACGIIDTEMNKFLEPDELEAVIEEIPTGRMGTPQEVAEFIYRLTDGNDYLTGQVIKFDGGWI